MKCFLCGHDMKKVEGLKYELCTNEKCVRSKPLKEKEEVNKEK